MEVLGPRAGNLGSFNGEGLIILFGCFVVLGSKYNIRPPLAKCVVYFQYYRFELLFCGVEIPKRDWIEMIAEEFGSCDEIGMRVSSRINVLPIS